MNKNHYFDVDWHWGKLITIFSELTDGGHATISLSFANNNPGVAFISDLMVEDKSRRKGFATQLIKLCEDIAKKEGSFRIDLKAEKRVPFLKTMYEKLGYSQVDEDSNYYWFSKMVKR